MAGARCISLDGLGPADAAALGDELRRARLACFPTDTVYGVGGALTSAVAARLVAAKGRDPGKPLQVVFPSLRRLEAEVPMGPVLRAACRALLPGPATLVVPYPPGWSFPPPGTSPADAVAGDEPGEAVATLGVRVPGWLSAARVLAALDLPLVASSANPSGAPPPAALDEVDPALLAHCDLVLDAGPVAGVASTVVDLARYETTGRWRLLRVGALSADEVAACLLAAEDATP